MDTLGIISLVAISFWFLCGLYSITLWLKWTKFVNGRITVTAIVNNILLGFFGVTIFLYLLKNKEVFYRK